MISEGSDHDLSNITIWDGNTGKCLRILNLVPGEEIKKMWVLDYSIIIVSICKNFLKKDSKKITVWDFAPQLQQFQEQSEGAIKKICSTASRICSKIFE